MSLALRISRAGFFNFKPKAAGWSNRGYGRVPLFDPTAQPAALLEKLRALQKRFRSPKTFENIVRRRLQQIRRKHTAGLFNQAISPRWKAQATMRALHRYFRAADSGWPQWQALREASAEFVRLTGKTIGDRQIRRIALRVDQLGGPELAPIDAYRDLKSVPHASKGKRGPTIVATPPASPRPSGNEASAQGGSTHG